MQNRNVTEIRSLGLTKVNRLVRAARQLDDLRPAFAEWSNGEIYVCKKTGTYRYRFGDKSKSVTAWSKCAQELFDSPAAFALAATVLGAEPAPKSEDCDVRLVVTRLSHVEKADAGRANIIKLASVA